MSDLIKRSDAINSIYKLKKTVIKHDVLSYHDGLFDALEIVQDLPSADRPRGEWIAVDSYSAFGGSEEQWNTHGNPIAYHYCSNCKSQTRVDEFGEEMLTDFCPNCGADMRGKRDE